MSQPQNTGGARQVTPEQADQIIARVKAGEPLAGMPTTPQTEPAKQAPPEQGPEPFRLINPPLAVFRAGGEGQGLQGFVLSLQVEPESSAAFYVVELTESAPVALFDAADQQGTLQSDQMPVGVHVAVYDAPSLRCLRSLLPVWAQDGCEQAFELQLSWRTGDRYVVAARRVPRAKVRKPAFACLPAAAPQSKIVLADGSMGVVGSPSE